MQHTAVVIVLLALIPARNLKSQLGIPAHRGSPTYRGCRRRVDDRMKHHCSRAGKSLCEGMRNWAKTRILFLFYFGLVSINVFVHLAKLNVH